MTVDITLDARLEFKSSFNFSKLCNQFKYILMGFVFQPVDENALKEDQSNSKANKVGSF